MSNCVKCNKDLSIPTTMIDICGEEHSGWKYTPDRVVVLVNGVYLDMCLKCKEETSKDELYFISKRIK